MRKRIGNENLYKETVNNEVHYYSYNTLVAVATHEELYMKTEKYSITTTRHCNSIKVLHGNLPVLDLADYKSEG
jgi:hypothetical protein